MDWGVKKRRLIRLRTTALPTFLEQVKPTRIPSASPAARFASSSSAKTVAEAPSTSRQLRRWSRPTPTPTTATRTSALEFAIQRVGTVTDALHAMEPGTVIGVAYMLTVGRRLVPDRMPKKANQDLSVHLYLAEVQILR